MSKNYKYYQIVEVQAGAPFRMGISNAGEINGIIRKGGGIQFESLLNPEEMKAFYKFDPEKITIKK